MIDCASTVEICAVRATRLDSLGNPVGEANNVVVPQDPIQLQFTPNIREGDDRELIGGCNDCIIASKTGEDQIRRYDLELQMGRLIPQMQEMLLGATLITDGGDDIGILYGEKLPCGQSAARVAFEAWSKRWTEDDEQDPVLPWWHWIWGSARFVPAQNTLQSDFGPFTMTAKTRRNTSWGFGPYGDQPDDLGANLIGVWADASIPTASCDYSTVAVVT